MQANGRGRRQDHGGEPTLSALLGVLVALTALRIALLAASPLDLFVDEAQYWLWSTTPDFGYYSIDILAKGLDLLGIDTMERM